MITLIRWYILKAKEIKLKLALYRIAEKCLKEVAEMDKGDWEEKFVEAFADIIHKENNG